MWLWFGQYIEGQAHGTIQHCQDPLRQLQVKQSPNLIIFSHKLRHLPPYIKNPLLPMVYLMIEAFDIGSIVNMKAKAPKSREVFDYIQKLIIIGDSSVGKSNLLLRFTQGKFGDNYMMTIGINYVFKVVNIQGVRIKLQIWDTAGQDKYKTITKNYYRNSQGVLVVFAIDDRESFRSVTNWIEDLTQSAPPNIQLILVANKLDLSENRQISSAQAQALADRFGATYMECSAKSGQSVEQVFMELGRMMKEKVIDEATKEQGGELKSGEGMADIEEFFPKNNIEIINKNIANNDPKTICDKIEKYDELDTEQRRSVVRNLPLLLEQLGNQGLPLLKPLTNKITKDKEDIARILLDKIGEIGRQLEKLNNFEEQIKTLLIPVLNYFLNLTQLDAKEQAGKELSWLAHKLNDKDRGDFVLKHVIEMAHDDESEDNRIVAVQLFSSMSECFGKNLCEQFIGLEILSLGEDISFKVRKEAIKHLPIIAKLVNRQFFSRLFSFYQVKSKDNSNWAIRKACVDIVLEISELCSKEEKESLLTEVMLNLLKDSNKWVRISAYKNLGAFIHQLKGLKFHPELLREFCRMADNDVNTLTRENDIIYSCAYNFPAVLDAVGREKWESDLWKVYDKLLKSQDKRIKQTLSESLHEVAKLLGEAYTEKYLFKVVDTFFKDKSDEIKLGVIKHMAEIMTVLSENKRETLIGVFEEFQKDQKKWRIRECIGKQLGQILEIYQPQTIFQYVVPILLKFCSDSVSTVREEAARKVADFIQKLSCEEGLMIGLIESVKAFGTSPKYTQRQEFLIMSEKLMNNKQLFKTHFLDIMVKLADDKVVNVKLVLAEIVKNHLTAQGQLSNDEEFLKLKEKLESDPNEEVRGVFIDN